MNLTKLRPLAIAIAVLLIVGASTTVTLAERGERPLTIAGDPCSLPLAKELLNGAGIKAELSLVGCARGVTMAAKGEVALGLSTENGLREQLPVGAELTVIARAPIVLIVNKANPVDSITHAELKKLYSGEITNWKELGGADIEIENIMLAPCVRDTVAEKIGPYSDGLKVIRPSGKVNPIHHTNTMVEERPGAVGQQLYGYESKGVKVLRIEGLLPTPETVPSNYILFEDYNMVTKGAPTGDALKLIEFARSVEGRKVIEAASHVPLL